MCENKDIIIIDWESEQIPKFIYFSCCSDMNNMLNNKMNDIASHTCWV